MNTLLVDNATWDLVLDASGNIAMAQDPYAQAQDVASAVRLFRGELWYSPGPGVPYLSDVLGRTPSLSYVRARIEAAALRVPGVVAAEAVLTVVTPRTLSGYILVSNTNGGTQIVGF